jgi:predicted AlkP superfamily pyrophosphatase or phosphodiesterase
MELFLFNELAVFEFGFVYYGFSFYEGCIFVFQCIVKFPHLTIWLETMAYNNHLFVIVVRHCSQRLLCIHGSNDLALHGVNAFFFLIDDVQCVYQPVS